MLSISKTTKAEFAVDAPKDVPESDSAVLRLKGRWVIARLGGVPDRLRAALRPYGKVRVDADALEALDSAGALTLHLALDGRLDGAAFTEDSKFRRLFDLVGERAPDLLSWDKERPSAHRPWWTPFYALLVWVGGWVARFARGFMAQTAFLGHVVTVGLGGLLKPGRIRWAAVVNIMQRAGIDAIPIVTLTSLFIGAVIGFIGVLQLQQYGGGIFAIDMVAVFSLREFAPLITAILLAGRSASAFAAEVGSMKMNQEIDAMRVMGIEPYGALVVPRILGLVIMSPFITMIAALASMFGGMLAIWSSLGAGPATFMQRLHDYVPFVDFFVGIIRPPFFAATIAIVGCWQGLNVKDDVLSLGRQVTTAVVQSIFLVFMLDAMFAILFNGFDFG
jgi:phospholipid/cholesterol/gamma-HCH transport system permease protein